jgi:hypothetical protein
MKEIVQKYPVEHGFKPDFHRPGNRPRHRPTDTRITAGFHDLKPKIRPPPSPIRRIRYGVANQRWRSGDEHLIGNLDAVHATSFTYPTQPQTIGQPEPGVVPACEGAIKAPTTLS